MFWLYAARTINNISACINRKIDKIYTYCIMRYYDSTTTTVDSYCDGCEEKYPRPCQSDDPCCPC
jgi:hypothetical protein